MDEHTYRILEYRQVVEIIAGKTTNVYGRERIEKMTPLDDIEDITEIQEKVCEAGQILDSEEPLTVGDLNDVRKALVMATKEIPLQPADINEVREILERTAKLERYLRNRDALYPRFYKGSMDLTLYPHLVKSIKKAVGADGRILNGASNRLADLRKSISALQNRIRSQLDRFIKEPEFSKMIQEPIITRREHRYVIPVKQEHRSQFPGIALDSSSSGATVFMEPLSVLKMTNELKYKKSEEEREEEKIRMALSRQIAVCSEDIKRNIDFIGEYDSLQAAARFMTETCGCLPKIVKKPLVDLKGARHPLLGDRAVPINIHVGVEFNALIITGPNTGGKTVSLKTAGLLAMLAMAGLPIPADEGSRIGIFTGIYADIGDEQSIIQNLSTFSSHMKNIVQILPRSGRRTLVLLDEIGAGTDPSEGVALGAGILKHLVNKGSRVIATTHYNELKAFASGNPRFSNAAVEFDEKTLNPTYKLQVGLPGRSCAIRIARRLGVPGEIIEQAEESMGFAHRKVESLLSDIDAKKALMEQELKEAEEKKVEAERLQDEYSKKLEEIEQKQNEILQEAGRKADEVIQEVFGELRNARREWRTSLKEYKEGQKERKRAKEKEKKVKSLLNKTIERLMKIQNRMEKPASETVKYDFKSGQPVKVITNGRRGKIAHLLDDANALVQLGNIKMEIPFAHLEPVEDDFAGEPQPVRDLRIRKALTISDQLDIRGFRVDDGVYRLEKYIDDACLANLETFRVIHGKGTGALKEAVRNYLSQSSVVTGFRDGELHEGGWGVTVVNL